MKITEEEGETDMEPTREKKQGIKAAGVTKGGINKRLPNCEAAKGEEAQQSDRLELQRAIRSRVTNSTFCPWRRKS